MRREKCRACVHSKHNYSASTTPGSYYVLENNLDRKQEEKQTHRDTPVQTPLLTRSPTVHKKVVEVCPLLTQSPTDSDKAIINALLKRVPTSREVAFTSRSPIDTCFLSLSRTNVTVILSQCHTMSVIHRENIKWDIKQSVLNIRKKDEQDHCCNFPNSVVAIIACGHCSRPEGFQDEIVRECSALVTKVEWFLHGHTEIEGTSFAWLLNGFKKLK